MFKNHKQLALVLAAFLITAASIVFSEDSATIGAFCGSFLLVVGAYTALDLKAIVKGTSALPSRKYVVADNWKYLTCTGLILLGPGAIGIIGFVVAGMKLNKAATMDGPKTTSEAAGTPND